MALYQDHQSPAAENSIPPHTRVCPCLQGPHRHHRIGTLARFSVHRFITPLLRYTMTTFLWKTTMENRASEAPLGKKKKRYLPSLLLYLAAAHTGPLMSNLKANDSSSNSSLWQMEKRRPRKQHDWHENTQWVSSEVGVATASKVAHSSVNPSRMLF